jgi:hypothetical protein
MSRKSQWMPLFVVTAGIAVAVLWFNWPPPVSKAEAIQAIRAFEGNDKLNPECTALMRRTQSKMVQHREFYIFEQMDARPGLLSEWWVNCRTGEVSFAKHLPPGGEVQTDKSKWTLTPVECQAIAQAFVRAKYRGFDSMGFTGGSGYSDFSWSQPGGSPWNCIDVSVDPVDGSIVKYKGTREPRQDEWGPR